MTDEERRVPAPQYVEGREVCGLVRLVPRDGEYPNQWGVICREWNRETYVIWRVWYDGGYNAENGNYGLPWDKALRVFVGRFKSRVVTTA